MGSTRIIEHCTIRTGSRLHFGLIRLGSGPLRFGGLGVMIEAPGVSLSARRAAQWSCVGPASNEFAVRVLKFAALFQPQIPTEMLPKALACELHTAPAAHTGLGSGTQLDLAIAAAVYTIAGQALPSPRQLAMETRRGRRSAIGCHGFYQGGLLFEGGKEDLEPLSDLQCRVDFPAAWRFVLIRPPKAVGVAGAMEQQVFDQSPRIDDDHAEGMSRLARDVILPATIEADFTSFSAALYTYGCLAGASFAYAQGGIFSHMLTRQHVDDLRRRGVAGVGQSSWGPTVFALTESESDATQLIADLHASPLYEHCVIWKAAGLNQGATIRTSANP